MQCSEVRLYLESYVKNELPFSLHKKIYNHLSGCKNCSLDADVVRLVFGDAQKSHSNFINLKKHENEINKSEYNNFSAYNFETDSLVKDLNKNSSSRIKIKKNKRGKFIIAATAFASILLAAVIGFLFFNQNNIAFLSVDKLYGGAEIGENKIDSYGMLKPGEWLNTGENSKSRIKLGMMGEIDVEPSSQIKLLKINSTGNYFYLQSGIINAAVWGASRRLFINTPAGEIIDFGSTFSFQINEDKSSVIKVKSGWAALHLKNQFVIVPAGNDCETNGVVGIPFNSNTTEKFKENLRNFISGKNNSVSEILNSAGKNDLISLWYLLVSSYQFEREDIFNRIKRLEANTKIISSKEIMKLDESALNKLWEVMGFGSKNYWKILYSNSSSKL